VRYLFVALAALLVLALPSAVQAAPDPRTCVGYAETRQFVDAQSWWMRTPGKTGTEFGHSHVGLCVPEREMISGTVPLDVRLMLHDNRAESGSVRFVVKGDGYEKELSRQSLSWACPVPGTCEQWRSYLLPTSAFDYSGWQEIRIRAFTNEPDGKTMQASMGFRVFVQNGKTRNDYTRKPWLRGKGWYSDNGYCEATYRSDVTPLPDAAVSGTWSPYLQQVFHGASDDLPVTRSGIRVDPDFHTNPPQEGTVLYDAPGEHLGPLPIDTLSFAYGRHRLHMRTDCDTPSGSTLSGILVVPFDVANGTRSHLHRKSRLLRPRPRRPSP